MLWLVTATEPCSIVATDFVMPMIPSPMMIKVRSPTRSTRWVCLKLTTLHTQEMAMIAMASITMTTYLDWVST